MPRADKSRDTNRRDWAESGDPGDYVQSLVRGLNVIRAFNPAKPTMMLTEVAEQTGMNRAATRRFLLTLAREGYVTTDGKRFTLSAKVLELGYAALASVSIASIAEPYMRKLSDELNEICLAGVLEGDSVVYVAKTAANRVLSLDVNVGSRLPAHVMSSGRVLLAGLAEKELGKWLQTLKLDHYTVKTVKTKAQLHERITAAREQGYSIVDEEYEVGFRSISAPVHDDAGRVVAAINVACPTPTVTLRTMRTKYLGALLASTAEIANALPPGFAVATNGHPAKAERS